MIPPENTIISFCAPPVTPVHSCHPSRLRAGLSLQLPPFGGTSLVRFVPLGRRAFPCIFHCMKLWYSAAPCRCLWLSLTHARGSQLPPCPPLSLDSSVKSPGSSHAVKYCSSLLSGPPSCCGSSLCFGSFCAHGPGSGLDRWRDGSLILLLLRPTIQFSPEHTGRDSVSIQMSK